MKRTVVLGTLGLTFILLSGCGQERGKLSYIGAENAKNLAIENAGVTAGQVSASSTDMGTKNGMDYYLVEFAVGNDIYQYDVDALTGKILESRLEVKQSGHNNQEIQQGEKITEDKAKETALNHAGMVAEHVSFVKSGLDRDDGRLVYDIEFYTNDHKEYDYDIDAYTGEVLSYDYDAEYYDMPAGGDISVADDVGKNDTGKASVLAEPSVSTQPPQADASSEGTISEARAKEIALEQVPGATAADIREFQIDHDDSRLEYEGKIYYDHKEYEFEIDGYSGAIRDWDVESIYD